MLKVLVSICNAFGTIVYKQVLPRVTILSLQHTIYVYTVE